MPQLPVPAEVAEASRSLGLGASAPELHGGLCGWLAGAGEDAGPGTDFHAIAEGYVSVTPLQVDLTRHAALDGLREWLDGMPA